MRGSHPTTIYCYLINEERGKHSMQKEIQLETPVKTGKQITPVYHGRQRRKHVRTGILFMAPALLNTIMSAIAAPQHAWLQEYPLVMIILANIWRGTAFSMLLYASGLEGI